MKAIIVGNSDGIGLGLTRELLSRGWQVTGLSRSESPLSDHAYHHLVADVQSGEYIGQLEAAAGTDPPADLCVYCAGIGELLDLGDMSRELDVFEVNLMGLVKTARVVLPGMAGRGRGHFIGLSSVADELISADAPSYHASKAGFSNYLECLSLAMKPKGVAVTNVRFGFVDTKMAKGDVRPFIMDVGRAVRHLMTCVKKRPVVYTAPKIVIPLVKFRRWMLRLSNH